MHTACVTWCTPRRCNGSVVLAHRDVAAETAQGTD